MKFDREKFFVLYRKHFGALEQYQVDGLNRLLTGYETYYGWWDNIYKIANSLAQIKHETAHSFMPVVEGYYLAKNVAKDKNYFQGNYENVKNFQKGLRYYPYFGIGDIQLTWKENYTEQDAMIRKYFPEIVADFESRTKTSFDLVNNPAQMLDGKISFAAMTIGMNKGTFTGKSFDRYLSGGTPDYFNMRSIVNGDKNFRRKNAKLTIGQEIANDSRTFEKILKAALVNAAANIPDEESDLLELEQADLPNNPADRTTAATQPSANLPENNSSQPVQENSNPPVEQTVEKETETPDGKQTVTTTEQVGDLPNTPPKTWFNVEDWKHFVFRNLKKVWVFFTGINLPQMAGFGIAAIKDMPNWYIYLAIAAGIFIFTLLIVAAVSFVLLAIWYYNRKEIKEAKQLEHKTKVDPGSFNLGLNFEKIY